MFPIGDTEVRGAGPGFVTIALIVINVAVFVLFEATLDQAALQNFFDQWAVVPQEILAGEELFTLLTSMFLHGGWFHLASNMVFLWVFGDNIEAVMGKVFYVIFYLLSGLAASAAHILFNPASTVPSVGASGAIAGVLGAYVVMFPKSRIRLAMISRAGMRIGRTSALVFLGIWFVSQLFNGIASLGAPTAQTGGVAVWAHIGGFVVGLVVGFLLRDQAGKLAFETG